MEKSEALTFVLLIGVPTLVIAGFVLFVRNRFK